MGCFAVDGFPAAVNALRGFRKRTVPDVSNHTGMVFRRTAARRTRSAGTRCHWTRQLARILSLSQERIELRVTALLDAQLFARPMPDGC